MQVSFSFCVVVYLWVIVGYFGGQALPSETRDLCFSFHFPGMEASVAGFSPAAIADMAATLT